MSQQTTNITEIAKQASASLNSQAASKRKQIREIAETLLKDGSPEKLPIQHLSALSSNLQRIVTELAEYEAGKFAWDTVVRQTE